MDEPTVCVGVDARSRQRHDHICAGIGVRAGAIGVKGAVGLLLAGEICHRLADGGLHLRLIPVEGQAHDHVCGGLDAVVIFCPAAIGCLAGKNLFQQSLLIGIRAVVALVVCRQDIGGVPGAFGVGYAVQLCHQVKGGAAAQGIELLGVIAQALQAHNGQGKGGVGTRCAGDGGGDKIHIGLFCLRRCFVCGLGVEIFVGRHVNDDLGIIIGVFISGRNPFHKGAEPCRVILLRRFLSACIHRYGKGDGLAAAGLVPGGARDSDDTGLQGLDLVGGPMGQAVFAGLNLVGDLHDAVLAVGPVEPLLRGVFRRKADGEGLRIAGVHRQILHSCTGQGGLVLECNRDLLGKRGITGVGHKELRRASLNGINPGAVQVGMVCNLRGQGGPGHVPVGGVFRLKFDGIAGVRPQAHIEAVGVPIADCNRFGNHDLHSGCLDGIADRLKGSGHLLALQGNRHGGAARPVDLQAVADEPEVVIHVVAGVVVQRLHWDLDPIALGIFTHGGNGNIGDAAGDLIGVVVGNFGTIDIGFQLGNTGDVLIVNSESLGEGTRSHGDGLGRLLAGGLPRAGFPVHIPVVSHAAVTGVNDLLILPPGGSIGIGNSEIAFIQRTEGKGAVRGHPLG